jgi:tetratricopeptide (TPR) repeat protein
VTHCQPTAALLRLTARLTAALLLAAGSLRPLPALAADTEPQEQAEPSKDNQQQAALLVARGRQLLASGDYPAATDVLQKAAKLAPANATVQQLLAQARAAGRSHAGTDLGQAVAEQQATRSRSILRQIEHSLFDAAKALDARNYNRAAQHARRALAALRYVASAERRDALKTKAERILDTAAKRRDRQRHTTQQQELARARAEAHAQRAARADEADGLQALRRHARQLEADGQHEKAIAAAEDILRVKPGDDEARAIRQRARDRQGGPTDVGGRSPTRARREDDFLASLEDEATPPTGDAVLLPGHGRTARGKLPRPDSAPQEPWEQELQAKLAQEVTVDFNATPLSECVKQLATMADVNIVLDPEASQDLPITMPAARVPVDVILRWMARFADLRYCIREGAVLLATSNGDLDEPVRKVYDISALIASQDDAVPTAVIDATLGMAGPVEPRPRTDPRAGARSNTDALAAGWVSFVQRSVAPGTWSTHRTRQARGPQYSIQYRNGRIVVMHTPEVHRQIEDLLNSFRRAINLQVHILGRFLRVEQTFLERLTLGELNWMGPDANGPGEDPTGGKRYSFTPINLQNNTDVVRTVADPLNPTAPAIERPLARFDTISAAGGLSLNWDYIGVFGHTADALINAVLKKQKGTVLQAPRLTCFNTQRANIQVLVNHNYVRSISGDEEPEIGNVPEGIIFDVQPFVSADRRYITLVLQPQQRELLSLIAFSYSTGASEVAEGLAALTDRVIQIPTTRLRSIGTTVTIPNGGTLVVGGFTEVEERTGEAGVPFLETVPLVNKVVRGFDTAEGRRSLLMMFTAETVEDIFED